MQINLNIIVNVIFQSVIFGTAIDNFFEVRLDLRVQEKKENQIYLKKSRKNRQTFVLNK